MLEVHTQFLASNFPLCLEVQEGLVSHHFSCAAKSTSAHLAGANLHRPVSHGRGKGSADIVALQGRGSISILKAIMRRPTCIVDVAHIVLCHKRKTSCRLYASVVLDSGSCIAAFGPTVGAQCAGAGQFVSNHRASAISSERNHGQFGATCVKCKRQSHDSRQRNTALNQLTFNKEADVVGDAAAEQQCEFVEELPLAIASCCFCGFCVNCFCPVIFLIAQFDDHGCIQGVRDRQVIAFDLALRAHHGVAGGLESATEAVQDREVLRMASVTRHAGLTGKRRDSHCFWSKCGCCQHACQRENDFLHCVFPLKEKLV